MKEFDDYFDFVEVTPDEKTVEEERYYLGLMTYEEEKAYEARLKEAQTEQPANNDELPF